MTLSVRRTSYLVVTLPDGAGYRCREWQDAPVLLLFTSERLARAAAFGQRGATVDSVPLDEITAWLRANEHVAAVAIDAAPSGRMRTTQRSEFLFACGADAGPGEGDAAGA
jgi:hypothetical protein